MADERPIQHTPKHLEEGGVFDPRHPAASAFAPAQPAAGVVADDVEEKGQNLQGGPVASEAQEQYSDQKEVLLEQHERNLRTAAGATPATTTVEGGAAKAEKPQTVSRTDKTETAESAPDKTRSVSSKSTDKA